MLLMLKFSSVLSSDVDIATHDQKGVGAGTVPGPIYLFIKFMVPYHFKGAV